MTDDGTYLRELVTKLRYVTTQSQAIITDIHNEMTRLEQAGALKPAPRTHVCRTCLLGLRGQRTLQEHMFNSHDGPLPDHWAAGDELAAPVVARAQSLPEEVPDGV